MKNDHLKNIEENYRRNRERLEKDFDPCRKFADFVPITFTTRFGGKAIYCHHDALLAAETEKDFLKERHIEAIRGVLKAWGMEFRGAKLKADKEFKLHICTHRPSLTRLKSEYENMRIDTVPDSEIERLVNAISKIKVNVAEKTWIVSTSKTLCHILPNLIPPIDRQYSLRFMTLPYDDVKFHDTKTIQIRNNSEKRLAQIFIEGMKDFFKNTEAGKSLVNSRKQWLVKPDHRGDVVGSFNTSLPKMFDNLVVAFVQIHRAKLSAKDAKE